MNTKLIMMAAIFAGTSAMAQTQSPPSSQTQIVQTRDFVSGLINRIASESTNRFNISRDYEKAGPELQARISQALKKFRDSMDFIIPGALVSSIEQYNAVARNNNISSEEKKARLADLWLSLRLMADTVASNYRLALSGLYRIEESWIVNSVAVDKNRRSAKVNFSDGTEYLLELDSTWQGYRGYTLKINAMIQAQIKKTLTHGCSTQTCLSNMIADYSAYLSDVYYLVDRDLRIFLADGKSIVIEGMSQRAIGLDEREEWKRYYDVLNVLAQYQFFDDVEFSKLPLRN